MDPLLAQVARLMVRDRDVARAHAQEFSELERLSARYQGQAEGYDMALATLAGYAGYGSRAAFEQAIERRTVTA